VADLTRAELEAWVDAYLRQWRAHRADRLDELFAEDAVYLTEPYAAPLVGMTAIRAFWTDESDPGEVFTFDSTVVACDGRTGVVRAVVRYGDPVHQEYVDLWVVTFDDTARAVRFEEWPFWPAHGRTPLRPDAVVVGPDEAGYPTYDEIVRSWALSAGSYRLAAGASDEQQPHGEDEVYVVTHGSAQLDIAGERTPVRPGTVAYVPRRVPHRFVDISEDLRVTVVFAPPEGSA
jgi:mannose-6-phosphate isomerase-like protein (cupin superfamily)